MTGRWWAHQHFDCEPDAIAFGKKTQVCGIAVGPRVDEVADNCFAMSSRINSTWGGNLTDMVRATRYLEVFTEERLLDNAVERGEQALAGLGALQAEHPDVMRNVRGRGLFIAFDLVHPELRAALIHAAFDNGLLVLGCGASSVRLRPALNVTAAEIDEGVNLVGEALEVALGTIARSDVGALN